MAACCLQLSRAWSKYGSCWLSACCVGFSACWVRVQRFRVHSGLYALHICYIIIAHPLSPLPCYARPPLVREAPGHRGRRFLRSLPVLRASYDLGGPPQPSLLPLPLPVPPLRHPRHLPLHHCAHLPAAWVKRVLL